jgi:hypothetical protein
MHGLFRTVAYLWALPTTVIGAAIGVLSLLSGGRARVIDGVVEVHGGLGAWLLRHATPLPGGAAAITFGHVVLGQDRTTLDFTRVHERVHVRQTEHWGPLFIPAYLIESLLAILRRQHFYRDNRFERQAYRIADATHRQSLRRARRRSTSRRKPSIG